MNEKNFTNKLIEFFSKSVVINKAIGEQYETAESRKRARFFVYASMKNDTFLTYKDLYTVQDLMDVGIEQSQAVEYLEDILKIPNNYKEALLKNKRKYVVSNYVESNTYYRMLNGEPPIGRDPLVIKGKKVTELTEEEVEYTYKNELDVLKRNNTSMDYKYLHHLGRSKVDYLSARVSEDYNIIYYPDYMFERHITRKIIDNYFLSLGYFKSTFLTSAFDYQHRYSNFIILCIIFTSINKMLSEEIVSAIGGEFDDMEALRDMFLTYNLPFDPLISKRYLKRIISNVNRLFSYKGTNRVLIDIVSLFGFDEITLNKYYLLKELKEGYDIYNSKDVPNNKKFDLNFVEIPITVDSNIDFKASLDRIPYDKVTYDDPYWGGHERAEVKERLLEEEFNYINTKYLSINTLTNVTKLTQETCFFFNYMEDIQDFSLLDDLKLINSEIKPSMLPIRIFDLIMSLQILISNKLSYDDIIIYTGTQTASLYGFNFKGKQEELDEILNKYKFLNDHKKEFGNVIKNPKRGRRYSKKEIVDFFFNNYDRYLKMNEIISKSDDINEIRLLEDIIKYNYMSKANFNIFKKKDGTYYLTYSEYLKDHDDELFRFVDSCVKDKDYDFAIQKIFDSLDLYFESGRLSDMFTNNGAFNRIRNYIYSLVNYFKAYTTEIKKFNMFFLIDDKSYRLKLIDAIHSVIKDNAMADSLQVSLKDKAYRTKYAHKNELFISNLKELVSVFKTIFRSDKLRIKDHIHFEKTDVRTEYLKLLEHMEVIKDKNDDFDLNEILLCIKNKIDEGLIEKEEVLFEISTIHTAKLLLEDSIISTQEHRKDELILNDDVKFY